VENLNVLLIAKRSAEPFAGVNSDETAARKVAKHPHTDDTPKANAQYDQFQVEKVNNPLIFRMLSRRGFTV
jgi:hypothetical protein